MGLPRELGKALGALKRSAQTGEPISRAQLLGGAVGASGLAIGAAVAAEHFLGGRLPGGGEQQKKADIPHLTEEQFLAIVADYHERTVQSADSVWLQLLFDPSNKSKIEHTAFDQNPFASGTPRPPITDEQRSQADQVMMQSTYPLIGATRLVARQNCMRFLQSQYPESWFIPQTLYALSIVPKPPYRNSAVADYVSLFPIEPRNSMPEDVRATLQPEIDSLQVLEQTFEYVAQHGINPADESAVDGLRNHIIGQYAKMLKMGLATPRGQELWEAYAIDSPYSIVNPFRADWYYNKSSDFDDYRQDVDSMLSQIAEFMFYANGGYFAPPLPGNYIGTAEKCLV